MSQEEREGKQKDEVRIHIDGHVYESPNPTTGAALYTLGQVAAGLELYREGSGGDEDTLIENSSEAVYLKEGEHFRIGPPKSYTIYVNGQEKVVTTKRLTYAEVVALAFPTPPTGENVLITVSYEDGPPANPSGSLVAGGTVKIKGGMIFNVTQTNRS